MVCIDGIHFREQLHSELHSYSLARNSWTLHASLNEPGPICDHSASMVRDRMIVFGGSMIAADQGVAQPSNDLWEWTDTWRKLALEGVKPEARKGQNDIPLSLLISFFDTIGQSQFTLQSDYLFIVGGSSQTRVCRDVWLFSFLTQQWTPITVHHQYPHDFAPHNDDFSCLPFCLVPSAQVLITFARLKRQPTEHERDAYSQFDFSHSLEVVRRRYNLANICSGFQIYRLDLSNLFSTDPAVRWLPSKCTSVFGSPARSSVFYSVVSARSEVLLFGGIEKRKLQWNRLRTENNARVATVDGTLAFVTLSSIPL